MTTTTSEVEKTKLALVAVVTKLDNAKVRVDELMETRRELFDVLIDLGVRQAEIARLARVTPMAVAFARGKTQ